MPGTGRRGRAPKDSSRPGALRCLGSSASMRNFWHSFPNWTSSARLDVLFHSEQSEMSAGPCFQNKSVIDSSQRSVSDRFQGSGGLVANAERQEKENASPP
ncbi:hypothetical protein BDD12DRAFT_843910 [Trichophaea hybrida]|nr:hypothetical protein BDD12DRAFT_843910 [Trichophaea hybrida]